MGYPCIIHEDPFPTCSVVATESCRSPANLEPPVRCRATCFACGLPVCSDRGCSRVRRYLSYGRRRICTDCAIEHELDEKR